VLYPSRIYGLRTTTNKSTTMKPKSKKRGGKGCGKPPPPFVLDGEKAKEFFGLPPKRRPGAPTMYTAELANRICEKLETGQTLRSICMEEGMPERGTVAVDWVDRHPEFAVQYARSLQAGIDALGEQTRDDSLANIRPENVPLARHRFDVARWYIGKRSPKKWGDKVQAELSGPDGAPISLDIGGILATTLLIPENLDKLSDAEAEAWQIAVGSIPKLLAPASPPSAKTIEGTATEIEETE
jgi:hypothetical protein